MTAFYQVVAETTIARNIVAKSTVEVDDSGG
jgi:hypothetical protein